MRGRLTWGQTGDNGDIHEKFSSRINGDYPIPPGGSDSEESCLYCDPPTTATWTDRNSAFQWILDGTGNWDRYDTMIDSTLTSQTRTDTNFNEYYQVGGTTLQHNDNGDMTSDGSKLFTWDAFGRLREVRSTTGTLIATYYYDADHRRVRKDLASGNDVDILFSGWQAIEYRATSTQAILNQVVFGNYLDEALCLDTYSGGSIASTDYYHQNALYSVYGISNPLGFIVVGYEYDPYGGHVLLTDGNDYDPVVNFNSNDTRMANGSIGVVNLTFTGQTFDPESGLLYYKRRYYHPTLGRFISRDPHKNLLLRDGTNIYQYVLSNPVIYTDSFGLYLDCGKHYFVGLCTRNVGPVELPPSIDGVPVPQIVRSAVDAAIPDHHDVLLQVRGTPRGAPPFTRVKVYDTQIWGFFADDFNGAVIEYAKSLIFPGVSGWVPGHVRKDSAPCWSTPEEVSKERYDDLKKRIKEEEATPIQYQLKLFNCQSWANKILKEGSNWHWY
jgi:RHS repeat-associated protein